MSFKIRQQLLICRPNRMVLKCPQLVVHWKVATTIESINTDSHNYHDEYWLTKRFYQTLFLEFLHTDRGTTCSENLLGDLSNDQECSDAVNYATSFNLNANYVETRSWARYPKGCYIYDSGEMYFNSHPDGENRGETRSICISGNK